MAYHHIPAMPAEVMAMLDCKPGKIMVDCTLGGSGHARLICEKICPGGTFIGIDQDKDAIENAKTRLLPFADRVHLFHGNFSSLGVFLSELNIDMVDGALVDLGVSLHQLSAGGRGFSFRADEPLDMRMDTRSDLTAETLLNTGTAGELEHIFRTYGEERWAKRIATHIIRYRDQNPLKTSRQLADLIITAIPKKAAAKQKIHPATRVFMSLRIAVNKELDVLEHFLDSILDHLKPAGRLCVLAFHSLEDRIVKKRFESWRKPCTCPPDFPRCVCGKIPLIKNLTPKVLRPGLAEIEKNPMARSTRLRAIEKL
ncbi:MAG: 16S rRNA (cytosine(1402)-N(4))-methyltransferase RsmH [Desulfobacteraceae bacterium]|nr:16S rRNA (cytosine(1402)-N(4))-methyltransferase RsmH [Desulfobacteraceae bacterium]